MTQLLVLRYREIRTNDTNLRRVDDEIEEAFYDCRFWGLVTFKAESTYQLHKESITALFVLQVLLSLLPGTQNHHEDKQVKNSLLCLGAVLIA